MVRDGGRDGTELLSRAVHRFFRSGSPIPSRPVRPLWGQRDIPSVPSVVFPSRVAVPFRLPVTSPGIQYDNKHGVGLL